MALLCYSRELAALDVLYLHCSGALLFFYALRTWGEDQGGEEELLSSILLYARLFLHYLQLPRTAGEMEFSRLLFTLVAYSGSYPRAVIQLLLNQCHESIAELRLGGEPTSNLDTYCAVSKQRCDHLN